MFSFRNNGGSIAESKCEIKLSVQSLALLTRFRDQAHTKDFRDTSLLP